MTRASLAIVLSAALSAPALAQAAPPPLQCPTNGLNEVGRVKPIPSFFTELVPPLNILNWLGSDPLAKLPTRQVSFRVVDEAGRPVPNALVGVIFHESKRFLAEGAAGGPAIKLPHGRYIVNAAVGEKDRAVRYGSTEVTIDAKGPASVTVKLTARAAPAEATPAQASVMVGTSTPFAFKSALRDSAVLAVVRPGVNIRAKDQSQENTILRLEELDEFGGPSRVALPGKVGKYDVVAALCAPRIPLARWSVATTPARIAIEAPARVPMGSTLRFTVSGTLHPAYEADLGRAEGPGAGPAELKEGERQDIEMKLPYMKGRYEIAVRTHDKVVLARRTIELDDAQLTITGPDTVQLGQTASFSWGEERSRELRLEIWTPARDGKPERRLGELREKRLIAGPGEHEIRLVRRLGGTAPLARKRFRVEGQAFESVPAEITAGSRVVARMGLKVEFFDKLYFYERGGNKHVDLSMNRSRDPRQMTAEAPTRPGSYDLVFLIGAVSGAVEAGRVPIEVRAP